MKISNILTAVNNNSLYIDFIPNFIKHWKFLFPEAKINIIPENVKGNDVINIVIKI
jgi:hypothetical protein